jgi:hypothetical protein
MKISIAVKNSTLSVGYYALWEASSIRNFELILERTSRLSDRTFEISHLL